MSHRDERSYVFGPFRLDCGERVLYRGNTPVALPPKAIQVLLCLVSNPRRVVDKDELLRMVWPDTFVEEGNLREQIFQIRRVLGDQNGVAYIETVPKRGYRFNADVQELRRGAKTNRNQRLAFLLTAVVLACLGIAVLLGRRPIRALRARGIELKPLTSYPGPELFPAISPDGDRVAFTWTGLSNDQIDLYARPINADAPVRLTYDRAVECYPTWSPDGTLIAFMQCDGNMGTIHTEAEVYVVGSSGGPKRRVGRVSLRVSDSVSSLAWMPDGKRLVVRNRSTPGGAIALFSLDIETGALQPLTSPPANHEDASPAVAQDGRTLAFVRQTVTDRGDIFVQDLAAGADRARQITRESTRVNAIAWASPTELVYLAEYGAVRSLRRVKTDGSAPGPLSTITQTGVHFSLSRDGRRLVYSDCYADADIVRAQLPSGATEAKLSTNPLISSTRWDGSPQYSPDGRKIAFASDRSGYFEIWIADADGSHPAQLTAWKRYTGTPRWSPSGDRVAVDSQQGEHTDIYMVAAETRETRQITSGQGHNFIPSWSRDGKWLYFVSDRTGTFQVWKARAESLNPAVPAIQVTKQGGFAGWESFDGKRFYYAKRSEPYCIWTVPVNGGEEAPVQCPLASWIYMASFPNGIYYAPSNNQIWLYNFAAKQSHRLFDLEADLGSGFAISPDRKWLLLSPSEARNGDLFIIDNFD